MRVEQLCSRSLSSCKILVAVWLKIEVEDEVVADDETMIRYPSAQTVPVTEIIRCPEFKKIGSDIGTNLKQVEANTMAIQQILAQCSRPPSCSNWSIERV